MRTSVLLGRRTIYALPTSPRSFIQFFATPENRCLLRIALPLDGVKISRLSIVKLHFVCVVAHDLRFRRWATAVNVKLILPPRQSRGVSRKTEGVRNVILALACASLAATQKDAG